MEDTIINEGEEEILNSDKQDVKTVYTKDEVEAIKKKLQSDTDKGVQKLIAKEKTIEAKVQVYEKVLDEISKIASDNTYMIDLYEENPEIAKMILDKYYDGWDINEYKSSIDYKEDYSDPKIRQKKITLEAKKIAQTQLIEQKTNQFIDKLKMNNEEKQQFLEAFEERKQLKSFKIDDIEKQMEKAYREIDNVDISKLKSDEEVAKAMSSISGNSGGNNNQSDGKKGLQDEISSFLKKYS